MLFQSPNHVLIDATIMLILPVNAAGMPPKSASSKPQIENGTKVGENFIITGVLGKGKTGAYVYQAIFHDAVGADESNLQSAGSALLQNKNGNFQGLVALKLPVSRDELKAITHLGAASPPCSGVPRVIASGSYENRPFVVMPVLGKPLSDMFKKLEFLPATLRWETISIVGKLLLRSLRDIHQCNYVHCDVQPDNILVSQSGVHLVDYGCARPYPGGSNMKEDWGSVDFNSIRSAQGGRRGPYDDLESLGWVLAHGFFGELPWFEISRDTVWDGKGLWDFAFKSKAAKQVRDTKEKVVTQGFGSCGPEWNHLNYITPKGLATFITTCYEKAGKDADRDDTPNYAELAQALGGSIDMESEEEDLNIFRRQMAALI